MENITPPIREPYLLSSSIVAYSRNDFVLLLHGLGVHHGCLCVTMESFHNVPSLRLFDPNSVPEYTCSFSPEVSAHDILPWLSSSCGDRSLTTPTDPSLRQLVLSSTLASCQLVQCTHFLNSIFIFFCGANLPSVAGAPMFPALSM
jgi:hypothetical protein